MKASDYRISAELGVLVLLACYALFGPALRPEAWTRHRARLICITPPMTALVTAIDTYEVDNGHLPKNLGNLLERDGFSENWNGPYLRPSTRTAGLTVKDEWGTPIAYTWNGGAYYGLRSAGPDRSFGTTDDVTRIEKAESARRD